MMNSNDNFIKSLAQLYVNDKQCIFDLLAKYDYYVYTDDKEILFSIIQDTFVYNNDFQNDLLALIKENGICRESVNKELQIQDRAKLSIDNKLKFNQFVEEEKAIKNRRLLLTLGFFALIYFYIKRTK